MLHVIVNKSRRILPALAVAAAVLAPPSAFAARARTPAEATVFIRLVGSMHATVEDNMQLPIDRDHVEIGTGSGFVISPYGYVLTNHHVVANDEFFVTANGRRVKVVLKTTRIEVCFPPEAVISHAVSSQCAEASVYASDPAVDLAVLFISTPDLPYVALGDSDAVAPGLPVDAFGYPFGRRVEIGQVSAPDIVPEVSVNGGTISALRATEGGEHRFLQVDNNLNPGNSGGPVVDRHGYAVGVIRMKLTGAVGIGFAIPINEAKDFLEAHGLDQMLPARRLRLGPLQSLEGKGIRLRFPEGLGDLSPFHTHVETDARTAEVVLRIDRIFSPWTVTQIEQALVASPTFERVAVATNESRLADSQSGRALVGRATGVAPNDQQETTIEYAVVDLGAEKLVARYVGPAQQIAFNESIVRLSLTGIAADRLLSTQSVRADNISWASAPQTGLPIPAGWLVEPGAPSRCAPVPQATAAFTTFPPGDFTVTVRVAAWPAESFKVDDAVAACSQNRGSSRSSSFYEMQADSLGVRYAIEGTFRRVGQQQVQLEIVAPVEKSALTEALLAAWVKNISR